MLADNGDEYWAYGPFSEIEAAEEYAKKMEKGNPGINYYAIRLFDVLPDESIGPE